MPATRAWEAPAKVLRDRADERLGIDSRLTREAADLLDAHEREHKVTFLTVQSDALARVREQYAEVMAGGSHSDLTEAVAAMLGDA